MHKGLNEFREWIQSNASKYTNIQLEVNDDQIILSTEYGEGEVTLNDIGDIAVIELSVKNKSNDIQEFYLHFMYETLEHAQELFNEMIEVLNKLVFKPTIKVLLSCSSGLTTGFFAEKINEANDLLGLNYHVDAVAISEIETVGNDYDMIFLAPQVSYVEAELREKLERKNVYAIPAQVFAKYDAKSMIELLEGTTSVNRGVHKNRPNVDESRISVKAHAGKILSIILLRNSFRVHMICNVYDEENHHLLSNDIIKPTLSLRNIYDLINQMKYQYKDILCIGLVMPGILNNGVITKTFVKGLEKKSVKDVFEDKYPDVKFVYTNDVNAAAAGYYACNQSYNNVSYIFQPLYFRGGVGNVVNGKLIRGAHRIAGQMRFAPIDYGVDFSECHKTPEMALDVVSKSIATIVSIVDPQAIGVTCGLIDNVDELKRYVARYIPEEYMPEITLENHMHIYMEFGGLIICANKLNEESSK